MQARTANGHRLVLKGRYSGPSARDVSESSAVKGVGEGGEGAAPGARDAVGEKRRRGRPPMPLAKRLLLQVAMNYYFIFFYL